MVFRTRSADILRGSRRYRRHITVERVTARSLRPRGVALDSSGNLYVTDSEGLAVRLLIPQGTRPMLGIAVTASAGAFTQSQEGVSYSISVSNASGAAPTSGVVTAAATLSNGLTLVSASGMGWSCTGASCTRSDALNAGAQPNVSTLNSWDGSVVANAAVVPSGIGGAIDVFVTNPTHVILDIDGYFAP